MATKPMRGPAGRAMHATERPKNTGKTMRRTMAFILKHYKWHCLAVVICIVLTVLAQLGEHMPYKHGVTGSSPVVPTIIWPGGAVG